MPETGSTNDDALLVGRSGISAGPLWFVADRQSVGRGRQGRVWTSPVGNLYCSLLISVKAAPACLPQLSHVAAVALVEVLQPLLDHPGDLRIKWPNDLLLAGAKVAGILVEGTRSASGDQLCVIGCGVNCGSHPEASSYKTTSLVAYGARSSDPSHILSGLRMSLGQAIAAWENGLGYPGIRARWSDAALPLDTPLVVRGGRGPVAGQFKGIDVAGRLLLMGPDGLITVEAGEVNLN